MTTHRLHMTGSEYKRTLNQLGLRHGGLATVAFLGISLSASHKYAREVNPIPKPLAMLLRYMVQNHLTPATVEAANNAGPPAADIPLASPAAHSERACETTQGTTAPQTYAPPEAPTSRMPSKFR